jgi:uncharacterized protein (DUF3084 family)
MKGKTAMEEKDFQRIEQLIGKTVKAEVGKAVKAEVGSFREEMKAEFGSFKAEIKAENGTFREEMKSELESVKEEIKAVRAEVSSVNEEVKIVKAEVGSFKEEIKDDFRIQLGIQSEDFQHKLQIVAEGHQMLSEKTDRMRSELNDKIDAIAADVAAHRADTEGHKRGYMVKEP